MLLDIYSKDLGEFTFKCSEGVKHDAFVGRVKMNLSPILRSASIAYQIIRRVEGKLVYSSPVDMKLVWTHAAALFKMNEALEFLDVKASSLPSIVANDFISKMADDENCAEWTEEDSWLDKKPKVLEIPPSTRLSVSNITVMLNSIETDTSFELEWITCSFGTNTLYEISWDLFLEMLHVRKPRMILGVDMIFSESEKILTIIPVVEEAIPEAPVEQEEVMSETTEETAEESAGISESVIVEEEVAEEPPVVEEEPEVELEEVSDEAPAEEPAEPDIDDGDIDPVKAD